MNNLCSDIGYKSINHFGEELCGDHVDIIEPSINSKIIVVSDGMGSGVKACILSTLTSKIISTMMAEGISIEECISTIAATLPICSERKVAYSTFTIIQLINNKEVVIVQYDNPCVIMLRDSLNYDYPKSESIIEGKKIYTSRISLKENDILIAMSDGCLYAGTESALNYNWKRENIISFMETISPVGYTAKTLATILVDECNKLYANKPSDDVTACVINIMERKPVNLLIGPPYDPDDCDKMMSLFFSKSGKHIVCGGTTASIAAKYLDKKIYTNYSSSDKDIPPISSIDGVDLVTEGAITISRVLEYAKDYLAENEGYKQWSRHKDGASEICRLLFEEATDINFYVGRAINPAHQNSDLSINFTSKLTIVNALAECLKNMGKNIKVSYF